MFCPQKQVPTSPLISVLVPLKSLLFIFEGGDDEQLKILFLRIQHLISWSWLKHSQDSAGTQCENKAEKENKIVCNLEPRQR